MNDLISLLSWAMFKDMTHQIKNTVSFIGTVIIALALAVLLAHFIAAAFQPVRWPTRYYFFSMFLIALFCSQRTSIILFIFALPIIPDFHLQLEAVWRPSVKYFVGHPGLDIVAGLCLGLWIKKMWFHRKLEPLFERVHWILGTLVIVIMVSAVLAVMRNLEINSILNINLFELYDHLLRFKLINHPNNYLPLIDLLTYCFAILTICVLTPYLRKLSISEREKVIFIPLIYGVIVSALWGIFQSFTGLGLSETTLEYRRASFGFGAQGFQPDIHAFAAIMLLGTVGVLGFLREARGKDFYLCCFCIAISWVALMLSKSKASLVLALLVSASFMIVQFRAKGMKLKKIFYYFLLSLIALSVLLFLTKSFVWIDYFIELLFAPGNSVGSNINKALVYRPELFRAALLMFVDSPIFGVGLGNFFRLSTNVDLTHSLYMAQKGGENAHNYFLQTMAETGVVGAAAFFIAISWPFFKIERTTSVVAPAMALLSIGLGNIFSHSLLIRPNIILLAVFLALLYASVDSKDSKNNLQEVT